MVCSVLLALSCRKCKMIAEPCLKLTQETQDGYALAGYDCLWAHLNSQLCLRKAVTLGTTAKGRDGADPQKQNKQKTKTWVQTTLFLPILLSTVWSFPMAMSLCHCDTVLALSGGISHFGLSVLLLPGNFESYLMFVKSPCLGPALIHTATLWLSSLLCIIHGVGSDTCCGT